MQQGGVSSHFLVKSEGTQNTMISGYASVFGVVDSYNDIIVKGAFNKIQKDKVKLLWQHDILKPIGIVKSLIEDDYGLKIEAEINNRTLAGYEAAELIKQRAVSGLSIGFSINSSDYNKQGQRIIEEVELMEVSVVTFPANQEAGIQQFKNLNITPTRLYREALDDLELLVKQLDNY